MTEGLRCSTQGNCASPWRLVAAAGYRSVFTTFIRVSRVGLQSN
jgi:hypothetical protein